MCVRSSRPVGGRADEGVICSGAQAPVQRGLGTLSPVRAPCRSSRRRLAHRWRTGSAAPPSSPTTALNPPASPPTTLAATETVSRRGRRVPATSAVDTHAATGAVPARATAARRRASELGRSTRAPIFTAARALGRRTHFSLLPGIGSQHNQGTPLTQWAPLRLRLFSRPGCLGAGRTATRPLRIRTAYRLITHSRSPALSDDSQTAVSTGCFRVTVAARRSSRPSPRVRRTVWATAAARSYRSSPRSPASTGSSASRRSTRATTMRNGTFPPFTFPIPLLPPFFRGTHPRLASPPLAGPLSS